MTITTIIISHHLGKSLSTPSISANPSTRMNMPGRRFSIILLSLISLIFFFVYKKKKRFDDVYLIILREFYTISRSIFLFLFLSTYLNFLFSFYLLVSNSSLRKIHRQKDIQISLYIYYLSIIYPVMSIFIHPSVYLGLTCRLATVPPPTQVSSPRAGTRASPTSHTSSFPVYLAQSKYTSSVQKQ